MSLTRPQDIGRNCLIWGRRAPATHVDPELSGGTCGLRPPIDTELREDRRNVVVDRPLGQKQPARNLLIRHAVSHELEHLDLARGEPDAIRPGRGSRST